MPDIPQLQPYDLRDLLVTALTWGGFVIVCVVFGLWLLSVLRRMDEEDIPGRQACPTCGYDVRATPDRCPECGSELPQSAEEEVDPEMPIYTIPDDAGPFVVVESKDGSFAVADERVREGGATAAKLGFVFIPCRDEQQAHEVAGRLNRGEHDGTIQVDLLGPDSTGGMP